MHLPIEMLEHHGPRNVVLVVRLQVREASAGTDDKMAASGQAEGRRHERGRDATYLATRAGAWLPGGALTELVGRFGLGPRVVLALMMNVVARRYRDTRLSAFWQSE